MAKQSDRFIIRDRDQHMAFHRFVDNESWDMEEVVEADPENQVPYELIFRVDDNTLIHYIEDPLVQFGYVLVTGRNIDEVVRLIRRKLDVYKPDELFKDFERVRGQKQKMTAVARLGVAQPKKFDQKYFDAITSAMKDKDAEVRRTAAWMTGYSAWPQYEAHLKELAETDPSKKVREDAKILLAAYHETKGK